MPRKPWSEIVGPLKNDPQQREEIETIRRAMRDVSEIVRALEGTGAIDEQIVERLWQAEDDIAHESALYRETFRDSVKLMEEYLPAPPIAIEQPFSPRH